MPEPMPPDNESPLDCPPLSARSPDESVRDFALRRDRECLARISASHAPVWWFCEFLRERAGIATQGDIVRSPEFFEALAAALLALRGGR